MLQKVEYSLECYISYKGIEMTLSIIAAKYLVDASQADSIVAMGRLAKMTKKCTITLVFTRQKI